MHDPRVVAFELRRPWPRRQSRPLSRHTGRWEIRGTFWTLAGRHLYWPALITVWHVEPGGRDSGTVCPHYRTMITPDGPETVILRAWRWHVWHWRIQIHPVQQLRRRVLTRCAWCGGRDRKGDPINVSHQWDSPRVAWWRGETGLYHRDCSSVARAHAMCLCKDPGLSNGDYGTCAFCGRFRAWGGTPDAADRALAGLRPGARMTPEVRAQVDAVWAARRTGDGQ